MSSKTIGHEHEAIISIVSTNSRYISAWNEVNARIAQRQNAVTIFVTLSSVIVTVLLSSRTPAPFIDPNLFSLLIPVVSLVFGFLNYKHDKTISLLRTFLAECEQIVSSHSNISILGYNSSKFYRRHANSARKFHDYSCFALVVIFNILGVIVVIQAFPDAFRWTGWPFLVYCALAFVSLFLVMRSTWWPHDFNRDKEIAGT